VACASARRLPASGSSSARAGWKRSIRRPRGQKPKFSAIAAEIAPCFVDRDGRRTDTVVLACTHYPLLLDRFQRLAPWPVSFYDPAPAIARRVVDLIGPPGPDRPPPGRFLFTSGQPPSQPLAAALARFGIAP